MGGRPPLGLDIQDRKLIINQKEAATVRHIYESYLALGSVMRLKQELNRHGILSKHWTTQKGQVCGGHALTRGALYTLIQNPIYIGKVRHKEALYNGQHEPIIATEVWKKAQELLKANRVMSTSRSNIESPSLLAGLVFDTEKQRLRTTQTKRRGRQHRYYVGTNLKLPAREIEPVVICELCALISDKAKLIHALRSKASEDISQQLTAANELVRQLETQPTPPLLQQIISSIIITPRLITIEVQVAGLIQLLGGSQLSPDESNDDHQHPITYRLARKISLKRCGHEKRILLAKTSQHETAKSDPSLLRSIARAHIWFDELKAGKSFKEIAAGASIDQRQVARTLKLAFLAPYITQAILEAIPHQNLLQSG